MNTEYNLENAVPFRTYLEIRGVSSQLQTVRQHKIRLRISVRLDNMCNCRSQHLVSSTHGQTHT